jgi:hypothetical protein
MLKFLDNFNRMKKHLLLAALSAFFLLTWACADKKDDDKETPVPKEKPSELRYSATEYIINEGQSFETPAPTVKGTSPFVFMLRSNPNVSEHIVINADNGVISAKTSLPVGVYTLDVTVKNEAGTSEFKGIASLAVSEVRKNLPSGLSYQPNNIETTVGKAISSSVPNIGGATPITFALKSVSPDAKGNITIAANGVITANDKLEKGTYAVSVRATNSFGSAEFNNVFTISVKEETPPPAKITFVDNVLPLMQRRCAPCHMPGGTQAFSRNYGNYNQAKAQIDAIISSTSAGRMPPSNPRLTAEEIELLRQWKRDGLLER